ncbi:MAG: outer membrane beta-barrel protein [Candidatus Aminicenantales bacterium]
MTPLKRCLILILMLGAALPSFGQSYRGFQDELNDILQKARISLGPFRIYPLIRIQNIGYDTNTQFGDNAIPDYTGTLSSDINVYLPFRRSLLLTFRDTPEYNYYLRERDRRTFTNSYAFETRFFLLSRFVVFGRYHRDSHWRRFSSELGWLSRDTARGYEFGLFYETARKTFFGLTGTWNYQSYEDVQTGDGVIPLAEALNRIEKSGAFEFYYKIFHDSFFFTKLGVTDYRFDHAEAAGRDARSYEADAGIRFPLLGVVQGTLSLGYKKFAPRAADTQSYSGIVGNTSLEMRLGRFVVRLGYGRNTAFSYFTDDTYLENGYSGGIVFFLLRILRLECAVSYETMDYPRPFIVDEGLSETRSVKRIDHQLSVAPSLVLRVFRQTGVGVTWGSARWISTLPGIDRSRNMFSVFLTTQF